MIMKTHIIMPIILYVIAPAFMVGNGQYYKISLTASAAAATAQEPIQAPPGGQAGAPPGASASETIELTGTSADINGTFKVPLPMPGGTKDSTFILSCNGSEVTGTITDPSDPSRIFEIYDGKAKGNSFSFSVMVGKTEFNLEGTAGDGKLSMTLTTHETIPLDDGTKIKTSKDTEIDGAYLVPVYSPGGIMENIFFLKTEGDTLTGQMAMISNPLRDSSQFFDGTVNGKEVSFYTRTTQSLFHFIGTIEGDKIMLNLLVTDVRKGIEGAAVK
ncbi:MAG: hypothetical protein JW944_14895 [Deltaproteobacteria bacterium]|nr:hypothetical protein [Deltaproteobacteria bacterium]